MRTLVSRRSWQAAVFCVPSFFACGLEGETFAEPPPRAVAPFDEAAARAHQEAWAGHLRTTVETTNKLGLKLVLIPPGEFLMGSAPAEIQWGLAQATEFKIGADRRYVSTEGPQHRVSGTGRVLRGGKWLNKPPFQRSAFRFDMPPNYRSQYFGFRVVCEHSAD